MNELSSYIKLLEEKLPLLASTQDLIDVGLARTRSALAEDRKYLRGIPFIRVSPRRIKYPKDAVIAYAKKNFHQTQ